MDIMDLNIPKNCLIVCKGKDQNQSAFKVAEKNLKGKKCSDYKEAKGVALNKRASFLCYSCMHLVFEGKDRDDAKEYYCNYRSARKGELNLAPIISQNERDLNLLEKLNIKSEKDMEFYQSLKNKIKSRSSSEERFETDK